MEFITDESRAGSLLFITLWKIRINMYLKFAGAEKVKLRDNITIVTIR